MLNKKTSIVTVAKRLGNTPEEIYKTYGHTDEQANKQASLAFISEMSI
ncbi:hypothetical protein [Virgibacillus sp. Bac330]